MVNQASTSTIAEEPMTVDTNYLSPGANNNNQNIDKLVQKLKLNWLKDKTARHVSYNKFFAGSIENTLIPKEMELSLELTTSNYDQEFIDNWYLKLKKFILMKDKVKFYGKNIEETAKLINERQIKLKQKLDKDEYDATQNTI